VVLAASIATKFTADRGTAMFAQVDREAVAGVEIRPLQ